MRSLRRSSSSANLPSSVVVAASQVQHAMRVTMKMLMRANVIEDVFDQLARLVHAAVQRAPPSTTAKVEAVCAALGLEACMPHWGGIDVEQIFYGPQGKR
jgi:hypothetical protein